MNTFETANRLIDAAKLGNGASYIFEYDLLNPHAGYSVGNGKQGCKFASLPDAAYLVSVMGQFQRKGYDGIGIWVDSGTVYVDPILWVKDGQVALAYGAVWGELAIYDHGGSKVIDC